MFLNNGNHLACNVATELKENGLLSTEPVSKRKITSGGSKYDLHFHWHVTKIGTRSLRRLRFIVNVARCPIDVKIKALLTQPRPIAAFPVTRTSPIMLTIRFFPTARRIKGEQQTIKRNPPKDGDGMPQVSAS